MYTSDNDTSAKSCLHNRPSGGPPSSQMDRKGVGTMLAHIFEAQTTPTPRTGETHEMKPNKTGETAIHLEVYSSIHTVYLPTRGDIASMRDTAIQHDTAIHLYNAIQCIGFTVLAHQKAGISGLLHFLSSESRDYLVEIG